MELPATQKGSAMDEPEARIMVVDCEPFDAAMIQYSLESRGFQALMVTNGQNPVQLIADHDPHLIILGVRNKSSDRFEMLRRIRDYSPVPVILVSAGVGSSEKAEGLVLGADDYLTTPVRSAELIARIRAVLRRVQFAEQKAPYSFFRVPS
jgi:DNA-binding response OmpR family regulator